MRPVRPALLYGGVVVVAAGFALIALTWGKVAGLDAVALQLPYLVSGGLTGLGLVIVGATAVNVHTKLREGAERERQSQQLSEILGQVMVALGGTSGIAPGDNGHTVAPDADPSDAEPSDTTAGDEGDTADLQWRP